MLEIKNATLKAGERVLFEALSLTVEDGKAVCVVGGEGTGKTLLMRMLLGLWPLASGFVSVDGELLTPSSAPVFRCHTAYVPQRPAPMGTGTVEKLARAPYNFAANKGKHFSHELLMEEWDALGLPHDLRDRAEDGLTAVQRQLVMLATGGALGKSLMLIDEPFADGADAEMVCSYIDRLASRGASVLVTTRRDMGDRFATIRL